MTIPLTPRLLLMLLGLLSACAPQRWVLRDSTGQPEALCYGFSPGLVTSGSVSCLRERP